MDNGCPECEAIGGLCLDCRIEQADADVSHAMNRLEELQKLKQEQEKERNKSCQV